MSTVVGGIDADELGRLSLAIELFRAAGNAAEIGNIRGARRPHVLDRDLEQRLQALLHELSQVFG